jgi:hypothetical protein
VKTAQLRDLDECISRHREALKLRPAPHSGRSNLLNNLAHALDARFQQRGELGDLDESNAYRRELERLDRASGLT